MRELHVVAVSDDGRHVVLATDQGATSGAFRVALDERLVAAVRGDLPRPGSEQPTGVTPKDIQARLRAGESVEDIATSAGVPLSKVERYAGPVLSERERMLSLTRAGHVSRSRLGLSALPLGEAVDRHLADNAGVRPDTITWTVRREDVGSWLVELSYVSQARRRRAGWRYDVARREVTPVDSASAVLAHVESGSPARSGEPAAKAAPVRREAAAPTPRARPRSAEYAERSFAARPAPAVRAAVGAVTTAPVGRVVRPAAAAVVAQPAPADARTAKAEDARRAKVEKGRKATADAARTAQGQAARKATADAARKARGQAARKAAAEAARKGRADAARKAAAEAARKASAEAARKAAAEAAREAAADAARQARAEAAQVAKAEAARKAAAAARKEKAAAARKAAAAAARQAPPPVTPTGPPTLRVVGGGDHEPRQRRRPQPAPAAARTAPARAAGQRASVPGWADVLLSTAPASRALAPDPDGD